MRTICITLPSERPERHQKAKDHFAERGVEVEFFPGIHAEEFGLRTVHVFSVEGPDRERHLHPKTIGVFLSHYALWSAMTLLPDEHVFVLEDDVCFAEGWKPRFEQAMRDVPPDFDLLYIGSCCAGDKPQELVKGEVWDVKYPLCDHAVVTAKKALPLLLETQRKVYAPMDIALTLHSFPKLKVYTVLPAICSQFNTVYPD